MPSHPDRVRRNYEDGWWKQHPPLTPRTKYECEWIGSKPGYTGPALWLTTLYLVVLVLVGLAIKGCL